MASLHRRSFWKNVPENATITIKAGKRIATWKDNRGTRKTAEVIDRNGKDQIRVSGKTWFAKYRDSQDIVREVSTGCKDRQAAQSILNDLVSRAERVRARILTEDEDRVSDRLIEPFGQHFDAYLDYHNAKGTSESHVNGIRVRIDRMVRECEIKRLIDVTQERIERWLSDEAKAGKSPRTRNSYLQALQGFCNWAIDTNRLAINPVSKIAKADERSDKRRQRRALTTDEINRLLFVAKHRPLAEFGRETKRVDNPQGRRTWTKEPLTFDSLPTALDRAREALKDNPDFIEELERRGEERELIYKTLLMTGLRRGELASITVGQVNLDSETPTIELASRDEKSRQDASIPLRADLADELRRWIDRRRAVRLTLNHTTMDAEALFDVPRQLVKVLDRDLAAAGIPKVDSRGRQLDVHAMRHTFGTHLSKAGVSPRAAQAAMRHSKIDLTMNVYTDPQLLDIAGAVNSLPSFDSAQFHQPAAATGTNGVEDFPPNFPLATAKTSPELSVSVQSENPGDSVRTQKNPENKAFSGVLESDADGTRTRNHWIDSQTRPTCKTLENKGPNGDGEPTIHQTFHSLLQKTSPKQLAAAILDVWAPDQIRELLTSLNESLD
ncbi:MAG: site-specific integrase [Planctomycetales bacterium]|nr:site-specific integrase [Planctomycetales bacterium]